MTGQGGPGRQLAAGQHPRNDLIPAGSAAAASGELLQALQAGWSAIRRHQRAVPPAVFGLSPRSPSCAAVDWLAAPLTLQAGAGLLNGTAADLLGWLLHDAAHGLAGVAGLSGSSEGRYHTDGFRAAAAKLGLDVRQAAGTGWSVTSPADGTLARYRTVADSLERALAHHEGTGPAPRAASRNGLAATCRCERPRRIRVSEGTFQAGPITCGVCGQPFRTG